MPGSGPGHRDGENYAGVVRAKTRKQKDARQDHRDAPRLWQWREDGLRKVGFAVGVAYDFFEELLTHSLNYTRGRYAVRVVNHTTVFDKMIDMLFGLYLTLTVTQSNPTN